LACLANGGSRQRLTPVHVASGKYPLPVAGIDRPPDEHDAPRHRANDRSHRDLRIDIEDECTRSTDEPLRLGRLQEPAFQGSAAARTKSVRVRIVVWMKLKLRHGGGPSKSPKPLIRSPNQHTTKLRNRSRQLTKSPTDEIPNSPNHQLTKSPTHQITNSPNIITVHVDPEGRTHG